MVPPQLSRWPLGRASNPSPDSGHSLLNRIIRFALRAPAPLVFVLIIGTYPVARYVNNNTLFDEWGLVLRLVTRGFFVGSLTVWIFSIATAVPGVSLSLSKLVILVAGLTAYTLFGLFDLLSTVLFGGSEVAMFLSYNEYASLVPTFAGAIGLTVSAVIAAKSLTSSERTNLQRQKSVVATSLLLIFFILGIWFVQPRVNELCENGAA